MIYIASARAITFPYSDLLSNLVLCSRVSFLPISPFNPLHAPIQKPHRSKREKKHTLLRQKKTVSLLNRNPVPAVLVVGREARRVRALADLAINHFLERVDALRRVRRVGNVHEMHAVNGFHVSSAFGIVSSDFCARTQGRKKAREAGDVRCEMLVRKN